MLPSSLDVLDNVIDDHQEVVLPESCLFQARNVLAASSRMSAFRLHSAGKVIRWSGGEIFLCIVLLSMADFEPSFDME